MLNYTFTSPNCDTLDNYFSVCSQMNTLSTQDTNDEKIAAFMSVLACAQGEAAFFLESAAWSVEAAVSLWLESGVGTLSSSYSSFVDNNKRIRKTDERNGSVNNPYHNRKLLIEGLPRDWSAWVNAGSGHVYFRHTPTGHTQSNVPPKFADRHTLRSQSKHKNDNHLGNGDFMNTDGEDDGRNNDESDSRNYEESSSSSNSSSSSSSSSMHDRNRCRENASADSCDVETGGDINDRDGCSVDDMTSAINEDRDREREREEGDDISISSSQEDNNSLNPNVQNRNNTSSRTNSNNLYTDLDSNSSKGDNNRMF